MEPLRIRTTPPTRAFVATLVGSGLTGAEPYHRMNLRTQFGPPPVVSIEQKIRMATSQPAVSQPLPRGGAGVYRTFVTGTSQCGLSFDDRQGIAQSIR
jgi:hypothetical protein